jgi:hypothetical protein
MGNSTSDRSDLLRRLLWAIPGMPQQMGWEFICGRPHRSWWGCGKPRRYDNSEFTRAAPLALFRKCVSAFCQSIRDFDTEGDPAFYLTDFPKLDIESIVVYDELLRVERREGHLLPVPVPKRGGLKKKGDGTMYLSAAGLLNTRVLFEEVAHAHKRPLRSGGEGRFVCHLDIFLAFQSERAREVYRMAPEEDQREIATLLSRLSDGRCDLRRGCRFDRPFGCGCDLSE